MNQSQPPELKVGVVGFGQRAELWREAHRPDDPDRPTRVIAVCDVSDRGRADARAALPEAQVTAELDVVLGAVDAVLITTPDDQHADVALAALRAGVAVFCEKPLAITVADCDEILRTAYATGTRLYVGHNMRHMPVVTQLREVVTSGRIGEVKAIWCRHFVGHGGDYYFKDWHADRSRTTSLLLQKGAHDLDVIHWLGGGSGRVVSAMGGLTVYGDVARTDQTAPADRSDQRMSEWLSLDNWPPTAQTGLNPVVDVEDLSMLTMRLDNGVFATYEQCHFTPDYWRNYTVIGTAGRVENLGDAPGGQIAVWDRRHDGYAPPDEVIPIHAGAGTHGGADPLLMAEFLRFAAEGGPTQTSPVAARDAVAVGCVATESLRTGGGALPVPPVDPELAAYFAAGQVRGGPAGKPS